MEFQVRVDSLNGNDHIEGQIINTLYKTIDAAYTSYRKIYSGEYKLIICIIGGYQCMSLDEYDNCVFKVDDTNKNSYLKINKLVTLKNVGFEIDVKVELNNKSKDTIIVTQKDTYFSNNHKIEICETNYNNNKSYPFVRLIDNKDKLTLLSNVSIKVCRQFTLVDNKGITKCKFPNMESQGGDLFYSEDSAESFEIIGGGDLTTIIIKNGIIPGYIYNTKVYNNFKLVNCFDNLVITSVNICINYDQNQTILERNNITQKILLFNIRNVDKIEDNIRKDPRMNFGDCIFIENSSFLSESNSAVLSNISNITKINTKLININYNFKAPKVKTIKNDYTIIDDDSKIFHVDDTDKNITVRIPTNLSMESSEIYFRKINKMSRNKVFIHVYTCYKTTTSLIILNRTHPEISIYESNGTFFTK